MTPVLFVPDGARAAVAAGARLARAARAGSIADVVAPRAGLMARARRQRREAPVLELLAATLPELRRGLTESAARTVAYELFEKLGFGAVAVTDRAQVLAFVGAGADHHGAGRRADPAGVRGARGGPPAARAARAPLRVPSRGVPAGRGGGRAAALVGRPGRRGRRVRDARLAARRVVGRAAGDGRRPALGAAAALGAGDRDVGGAARADGAALRLQRAEHDRLARAHRSRPRARPRARVRRLRALEAGAAERVHHARRRAAPRAELPRPGAGALRRRSSR